MTNCKAAKKKKVGIKLERVSSPAIYPETQLIGKTVKVLDTHVNLAWLLRHFKAVIRHNKMTRKREITIPKYNFFKDDISNDSLAHVEYIATINHMPYKQTNLHLTTIANKNAYHPIVECIKSKKWDGMPRLDDFIGTIKSTKPELDRIIIKTWMMSAIASAFSEDGFTNHGVLTLQGDQGIGKTAWVRKLDPADCGAVKVGALLDPKRRDSFVPLSRFWIVELGELDGIFKKADIAHLKSYITSPSDDVRLSYAREDTCILRRTAYIATVNNTHFLVDETGNRRWWTVCATSIDYQHNFDMQQVWAEAKFLLDEGALTYLPDNIQRQVNEKNRSHEKIDPFDEILSSNYDWSADHRRELSATDVLIELGYNRPTPNETSRMGKSLRKANRKDSRKKNGNMVHEIPPKLDNRTN
jgi:putative DNA primase/helicase